MTSAKDQQTSGFFRLAGELRNTIYRQVLVAEQDEIIIEPFSICDYSPLLQVSRQIRHEASSILYGENTFRTVIALYESRDLLAWLRAIGREQARHISSLKVTLVSSQAMMRVVEGLFPVRDALWGPGIDEMVHEVDRVIIDKPARAVAAVVLFRGVRADVVQVNISPPGDSRARSSPEQQRRFRSDSTSRGALGCGQRSRHLLYEEGSSGEGTEVMALAASPGIWKSEAGETMHQHVTNRWKQSLKQKLYYPQSIQ